MKKNLKKAISAVLALALSVGSAAMAAPTFTDVAETASYAQAVNTLAALGVISGYEDGTFKPDNNITRAEVATMVVAALNRSADAEGAKGTTKFDDMNVDAKAWATGFVNIGVSEGFISGFEDGTFKPDNNVTFAQMVSMLVRVAGYGRYAEYLGGWPNGYLSVGNDKGVTKGVSAGADTAVTRGQVAQMIYNTLLDVPMVESTTLTTDRDGNLVPEMTIMDGKNDNQYKTMLTEKHDAYYVEGYVSNTNRTNSAKFDADEVEFTIEYTENYDDSDVVISKANRENNDDPTPVTVYVGGTDAAANIFAYAAAIIKIDEDDDATLVSYIPSGKNTVETFDASLIDDEEYLANDPVFADEDKAYIRYYSSKDASKSQKYNLASEWQLYVNGVEVETNKTNFEQYVLNNTVGEVQLIDRYMSGSKADGDYDIIFVTYYATAMIGSVNATSGKIAFDSYYNPNERVGNIVLDPEDEDLVYDIFYNGEEVELSALQINDVISIAYNVEQGLDNSDFYEISVSRATAEGKYTGKNDDDELVTIGGTGYEFVQGYGEADALVMADEYTLYLDAFGRIFSYETLASSAKLAIIDRFTKSSADDYYRAMLYTTDGAAKSLEVDTTKVTNLSNSDILAKVYKNPNDTAEGKTDIQDRVVKYKISSSSGRVISLEFVAADKSVQDQAFKANSNSLGSIKLNDATKVIDAIDYVGSYEIPTYSDLSISSVAGFIDDGEYTAYAYGDKNTDGTYPMVIVTSAGGNYTYETNFAVLTATPGQGVDSETGDDIYTVEMLYQGEVLEGETAVKANDDVVINGADDILDLRKGDVIVFVKDNKGNIKAIDVLITAAELGVDNGYEGAVAAAFSGTAPEANIPSDANNWTKTWTVDEDGTDVSQAKEVTRLVYGPVVEKKSNYFKLASLGTAANEDVYGYNAKKEDGKEVPFAYSGLFTDISAENGVGGAIDIDFDNDTYVYVYDFMKTNSKLQLECGTSADVAANILSDSYLCNSGDYIAWDGFSYTDAKNETVTVSADDVQNGTVFAFAKVVDGTATDVYVILPN